MVFTREYAWMAEEPEIPSKFRRRNNPSYPLPESGFPAFATRQRESGVKSQLVYVFPRELEMRNALDYVKRALPPRFASFVSCHCENTDVPVRVTTFDRFRRDSRDWMTDLDRVTLAVDVELRPSMYGELFWSYLCELLSRDPRSPSAGIPVIDILMLSPYACDRTVRFVEQFCPPVQMIEVPDLAPFPAERIKVDWNLENDLVDAAELFYSEDDGAVVVIVGRNPRKVGDFATAEITRASAFRLPEIPPSRVYWVDPEADLTLALPRIDLLLINCVLVRQRYLDQNEVVRALSWALKTQRPDRVPVVLNIRPSDLDRRDELTGAA
ncbi:hypothetical protein ABKA04_001186 [Annulohypoxylon sp. FPYF3050]